MSWRRGAARPAARRDLAVAPFQTAAEQTENASALIQAFVAAGQFPPERRDQVLALLERIEKAAGDAANAVRKVEGGRHESS